MVSLGLIYTHSVQFSSVMSNSLRPHGLQHARYVHHQLPELTQTHVHRVSDAIRLIFYRSLLLLPSIFPSVRVFSNESVLPIRWPKELEFQFQHQSFQ